MSERARNFLICMLSGAVLSGAVFWMNLSRGYPPLRCLCDGFFVTAVMLLGMGGIMFARNQGTFDVAGFGLRSAIELAIPALRRDEKEDFQQYCERKAMERKSSAGLLLAGAAYLALSVAALLLYYLLPR